MKNNGGASPCDPDVVPDDADLLTQIEAAYARKGLSREWEDEEPVVRRAVRELRAQLGQVGFVLNGAIAIGSTAIVLCAYDTNLRQQRAVKVPRPVQGRIDRVTRILRVEREKMAPLNHENVTRIYYANDLTFKEGGHSYTFPYFVMDYFVDIDDLDMYVEAHLSTLTGEGVIELLRGVMAGVAYLHSLRPPIVHCDLKPGNLLVSSDKAMVADLGYAKHLLPKETPGVTTVTFTLDYAHPNLARRVAEARQRSANEAIIGHDELKVAFDLFALGRTIQELLSKLRQTESTREGGSVLSAYQWEYLELISKRLLDGVGDRADHDRFLDDGFRGIPSDQIASLKYLSADEALEDVEKLLDTYDLEGAVPELNPNIATYIQVPRCQVALTSRVRALINHPAVARLGQVTQLGFVSMVYPGAAHSRFEHTLGVFAQCCEYVRALWYDQSTCLFRSLMRVEDIEACLAAALVHDVGQYSMAHDLTEIGSGFKHERYTRPVLEEGYGGGELSLARVIERDWTPSGRSMEEEGGEHERIDDVLEILEGGSDATIRAQVLHSILSGPMDCDKLDYLQRDSNHLGTTFGEGIDRGRLLRSLTTVIGEVPEAPNEPTRVFAARIGVREKSLPVARSLWAVREDMFRQVYWHHTVRSFKAMLGFVVRRILGGDKVEDFWDAFQAWRMDPSEAFGGLRPVVRSGDEKSEVGEADVGAEGSDAERVSLDEDIPIFLKSGAVASWGGSSLAMSDDSLLHLLSLFTDDVGRGVLAMIRERRPYKRVAEVPYASARGSVLFNKFYNHLEVNRSSGNFAKITAIQADCEKLLIEELGTVAESRGAYESGAPPWRHLLKDKKALPVVLLDFPARTVHSRDEEGGVTYRSAHAWKDVGAAVRSEDVRRASGGAYLLDNIGNTERFDRAVGYARVFVLPEWAPYFGEFLGEASIIKKIGEVQLAKD